MNEDLTPLRAKLLRIALTHPTVKTPLLKTARSSAGWKSQIDPTPLRSTLQMTYSSLAWIPWIIMSLVYASMCTTKNFKVLVTAHPEPRTTQYITLLHHHHHHQQQQHLTVTTTCLLITHNLLHIPHLHIIVITHVHKNSNLKWYVLNVCGI